MPMIKFPSTPHLSNLAKYPIRGDKVLSDHERAEFLSHEIIVEEKIDGANLGISFNLDGSFNLHNRGNAINPPYLGQWKKIPEWLNRHIDELFDELGTSKMMFGEWCYAKHSILYNRLPDWFIGFDVYDLPQGRFLSTKYRNTILSKAGIPVIKELGRGLFSLESIVKMLKKSTYGDASSEGLYLRIEEGKWLMHRAKIVRPVFMQSIDIHWSRKQLHPNKVLLSN
jgi:ATP-dependent RNA circularization protein (DNA/RNA ligase family)